MRYTIGHFVTKKQSYTEEQLLSITNSSDSRQMTETGYAKWILIRKEDTEV